MGFDIVIGQAVGQIRYDFKEDLPNLRRIQGVERRLNRDAPLFINDLRTGQTNARSVLYSAWSDTLKAAGLGDLFFEEPQGLMCHHPGVALLTREHAGAISAAVASFRANHPEVRPGFSGWNNENPEFGEESGMLARLLWLDYWVCWAVENCELPVIENF